MHPKPQTRVLDTTRGLESFPCVASELSAALDGWPTPLLFMDFETSGSLAAEDQIVEIAAIRLDHEGQRALSTILRTRECGRTDLHGITPSAQVRAPTFEQIAPLLGLLADQATLVSHSTALDRFMAAEVARIGGDWQLPFIDTYRLVKAVHPSRKGRGTNTLYNLCDDFGVPNLGHHLAAGDVLAVARLCAALARDGREEVLAALPAIIRRPGGANTWPAARLPASLTLVVRTPRSAEPEVEPAPSPREDPVPRWEPAPEPNLPRAPISPRPSSSHAGIAGLLVSMAVVTAFALSASAVGLLVLLAG